MGLSHEQHAEQQANLNPPPPTTTPTNTVESTTIGNELTLRGIPVVGTVGGAIIGTRPGIDTAAELEKAGREIMQGMLRRTRRKDHP